MSEWELEQLRRELRRLRETLRTIVWLAREAADALDEAYEGLNDKDYEWATKHLQRAEMCVWRILKVAGGW